MDDRSTSNQFNITFYPFVFWGFGLVWLTLTSLLVLWNDFSLLQDFIGLLFVLISSAIFWVAPSIETIIADKSTRILTIKTARPILGANITEIFLDEIVDCQLRKETIHGESGTEYVYRVVILKKSGEIVPLTQSFASEHDGKAAIVSRLVVFLGLPGNPSLANLPQTVPSQANQSGASFGSPQVTSGITWRLDRQTVLSMTVVRWACSDFSWPGRNFLVVLQQAFSINNKLGRMSVGATRKNLLLTIASYGVFSEDQPNFDEFEMLPPNPQLDTDFVCLSNAPDTAVKLLNAAIINTLHYWAECHPARKLTVGDQMMQMVVILSPSGTYLCALGKPDPGELDDMIALGVEIVRQAQQAVMP